MKGKNYALNFPLRDGISDENYKSVFEPVSYAIVTSHSSHKLVGHPASNGIL